MVMFRNFYVRMSLTFIGDSVSQSSGDSKTLSEISKEEGTARKYK